MKNKNVRVLKIIMLVIFLIIMTLLTIKLVPIFKNISTEEGRINFKTEIESLGYEGMLIIIGLMVVQIFLPILPGEPVEVLARNVIRTAWRTYSSISRSISKQFYNFLCSKKIWKKFYI